ncbi:cyclic nucleotide-binding domain-containing protein [Candidatus Latescibacterota bacterium]
MDFEARRSGLERRIQSEEIIVDNRKGKDRRVGNNYFDNNKDFVKNIPIFKGLNVEQIQKIINICSMKTYLKGHFVCQEGEESNELFIFLNGQLKVVKGNTFLSNISPLGLVGEIGVFTGKPRSASVVNTTESNIIKISKNELFQLFKLDHDMNNRILLNVISDLANKLQIDNELLENLRNFRLPTML